MTDHRNTANQAPGIGENDHSQILTLANLSGVRLDQLTPGTRIEVHDIAEAEQAGERLWDIVAEATGHFDDICPPSEKGFIDDSLRPENCLASLVGIRMVVEELDEATLGRMEGRDDGAPALTLRVWAGLYSTGLGSISDVEALITLTPGLSDPDQAHDRIHNPTTILHAVNLELAERQQEAWDVALAKRQNIGRAVTANAMMRPFRAGAPGSTNQGSSSKNFRP